MNPALDPADLGHGVQFGTTRTRAWSQDDGSSKQTPSNEWVLASQHKQSNKPGCDVDLNNITQTLLWRQAGLRHAKHVGLTTPDFDVTKQV